MQEENSTTNSSTHEQTSPEMTGQAPRKKLNVAMPKFSRANMKIDYKALFTLIGFLLLVLGLYAIKGYLIPAMVNGKPIFRSQVISELERRNGQQVLESLVNQSLLEQEAKKKGITVSDEEIENDIKQIDDNMKQQGSSVDEALSAQNLDRAEFKKLLHSNKLLEKIIADKVAVTDDEVKSYIETNKATLPTDMAEDQLKTQLKNFLQQQKVETESKKLFEELRKNGKVYFWRIY
jgi:hypothetical protein